MPRITEIFLVETPTQHALAIWADRNSSISMLAFIRQSFIALAAHLKKIDVTPAGPPFLHIADDGDDPEALHIMVGIAVPHALGGSGDIQPLTLRAGEKALCYWQGDPAGPAVVYEEMQQFAAAQGRDAERSVFEYSLNGLEYGEDRLLTRVVIPLKK